MYNLYFFEGQYSRTNDEEYLIREIVKAYCQEKNIVADIDNAVLAKAEKGKPYFIDTPIEFNISHSRNLWACIVGEDPCGVDLQLKVKYDYDAIAQKLFSEKEKEYVWLWGGHGFFKIWTKREAYGKYTGQGMWGDFPDFMLDKEEFIEKGTFKGVGFELRDIPISDDIFCTCCIKPGHEINVIFIN